VTFSFGHAQKDESQRLGTFSSFFDRVTLWISSQVERAWFGSLPLPPSKIIAAQTLLTQNLHLSLSEYVCAMLTSTSLCRCGCRREDSSFEREPLPTEPPAKRVCTISPAPRHSPALTIPLMNPGGQFHPTPPPLQHYTLEDIATSHLYRDPSKMLEHREIRDRHSGLGEKAWGAFSRRSCEAQPLSFVMGPCLATCTQSCVTLGTSSAEFLQGV